MHVSKGVVFLYIPSQMFVQMLLLFLCVYPFLQNKMRSHVKRGTDLLTTLGTQQQGRSFIG